MIERGRFLRRAGFSVLLIDLRGTGETVGNRITFGWEERADVLAAVDFLRKSDPDNKVGIIGSSLGGAAALLAAPPLKVDALVTEAVYPNLSRATHNRLRKYTGPLDRFLTPLLLAQLKPRLGVSADDLRPVDHLQAIGCPIFVIGGAIDQNTTTEDTRSIFDAAGEPKEFWLVEKAGHVDYHRFAREEYEWRVTAFLMRALKSP